MPTPLPPDISAGPGTLPPAPDWSQLAGRLRRYALALAGNATEADDLAQQTIARLLARQADKADHFGYARQTLTRLWLDRQRSVKRRLARLASVAATRRHGSPHATRRAPDGTDDPSDSASRLETARRVRQAVAALPPMQRAAIVLRFIEDMDYAHIATIMETSEDSVRSSLHLARRKLRDVLGDLGTS